MALPTLMYATVAYIDRNTAWDDVDFHVSRRYDSNGMWQYVQRLCERAKEKSVRLLDITVMKDDGEEVWNWRRDKESSKPVSHTLFWAIPTSGCALFS